MSRSDEDGTPLRELAPSATDWRQRASAWWRRLQRPPLESGWASLCGSRHSRNQDAVIASAPLFAVADGVGGGSAGELASSAMLAYCRDIPDSVWQDAPALSEWLRQADEAVAQNLRALNTGGLSATTFAGAWLDRQGRGHIAHVGDARILLGRPLAAGWQVGPITLDQTYAHVGEDPPPGGSPDDPARMVGVGAIGQPPVAAVALKEGEWLLLCSDGLHRFLPEAAIAALWSRAEAHGRPIDKLAQQLALAAHAAGSHDDISVLLVRRNPRWGVRRSLWLALAATLVLAIGSMAWKFASAPGQAQGPDASQQAVPAPDPSPPAASATSPGDDATILNPAGGSAPQRGPTR